MYKVFIENKPLHIIDKKDFIPKDSLVIYEEHIEIIRETIFHLIRDSQNRLPIYLVSPSIDTTFLQLFEGYDFIEAAGGIVKRKGSFLFIKRNGFWDIPKGKIEKGESPEVAAIREIEEECGIFGPTIEQLIGITYHTYFFKSRPTIKKTYWYSLKYVGSKKTVGQLEEGVTKVKWFKEGELLKVKKNTFDSIIEVMDLYFK